MKLRGAIEIPILVAVAFAAILVAWGVGYKKGDTNVEYEGNLWCVSNYVQKEPTEYLEDGRPKKSPLLEDRGDWIRKDQVQVDSGTNNPEEAAMNLATKDYFERATKEEMVEALQKGDKDFFTHHYNETATSAGPCWGTGSGEDDGQWINDAVRSECLETSDTESKNGATAAEQIISNVVSGKCGDLRNPNAVSSAGIASFLAKNNSPMEDYASAFIEAAKKYQINPALLVGISGAESSFGKSGRGKNNMNPGNVKTSSARLRAAGLSFTGHDDQGHVQFSSWRDGILGMAEVLQRNYFSKGRDTLAKISKIYLEGDKQSWMNNINIIMRKICGS